VSILTDDEIAREVALDLCAGQCVNLGIGLPTRVALFVPPALELILHSENGILGMGPAPAAGQEDPGLVDAGKNPVTLLPGGSFVHHADSFAIVRGGHIDVAVLGAYEVSMNGDLANWHVGGGGLPAVGGAMDLAAGAKEVRVITRQRTRDGAPKLVRECTYPITGRGSVDRIYTELGVFEPTGDGFLLTGLVEGCDIGMVRDATGAPLQVAPSVFSLPRNSARNPR
jgi:3-oxoadipate CoA-transferase, beta subunit